MDHKFHVRKVVMPRRYPILRREERERERAFAIDFAVQSDPIYDIIRLIDNTNSDLILDHLDRY